MPDAQDQGQPRPSSRDSALDTHLLDELTELNNEMAALQRELARQKAALERLNALKDQFLGMAAHDLRTPLNVICGYAQFLEEEARDVLSATHLEFVQAIRSSGQHMLGLVNDLLDVSVIESGRLDLQTAPTDVAAVAERVVRSQALLAAPKRIDVRLETLGTTPSVPADAERLVQVLANLIGNAVKFSPSGEAVVVTVRAVADGVETAVVDHGKGMTTEQMSHLFTPFGIRKSRGTAGEPGTGLGLAICKRIVEAHGGQIWAESEQGVGSTFRVVLPYDGAGARASAVGLEACARA